MQRVHLGVTMASAGASSVPVIADFKSHCGRFTGLLLFLGSLALGLELTFPLFGLPGLPFALRFSFGHLDGGPNLRWLHLGFRKRRQRTIGCGSLRRKSRSRGVSHIGPVNRWSAGADLGLSCTGLYGTIDRRRSNRRLVPPRLRRWCCARNWAIDWRSILRLYRFVA